MASNPEKMRQRWQGEEYRAGMLKTLDRARDVYTSNKRLVAEAIYRCRRTQKLNKQRTQVASG